MKMAIEILAEEQVKTMTKNRLRFLQNRIDDAKRRVEEEVEELEDLSDNREALAKWFADNFPNDGSSEAVL